MKLGDFYGSHYVTTKKEKKRLDSKKLNGGGGGGGGELSHLCCSRSKMIAIGNMQKKSKKYSHWSCVW